MLPISGTFLDEITHDIPSQNWGEVEWRREFELFQAIGIDTVILIRAGYQNRCVFPSKVIPNLLPVYDDLAELFLSLADEHNLRFFFGLYDSGFHWIRRTWWREVEINAAFIEEVVERYGHHPSFQGWYLCHEVGRNDMHVIELIRTLASKCKSVKDLPTLISPYPHGPRQGGEGLTLEETFEHWDRIFGDTADLLDICAFQDGQVLYEHVPDLMRGLSELGANYGITMWSNVETFARDMPIKFPPADWRNLRWKMEAASPYVEKLITFEFSHFLSPHSCYLAARNLFRRYAEHFGFDASRWLGQQ